MKINIKNTFMAAVAVLALASCSEGQYWTEPADKGQVVAFVKPAETVNVAGTETPPTSFTVKVYRSQTAGDLEYPVTCGTKTPDVLSGPSTISFKNGENYADYTISIGELTRGVTYTDTLKVAVPEGTITHPDARNLQFVFSITHTLSWSSLGKGTFFDAWVMDGAEEPYSVEIQKADGMDRYRVVAPYKEYFTTIGPEAFGDWVGSTGPDYVEFWDIGDGKLSFKAYATGLLYEGESSQPINAYPWSAFNASAGFTGDFDMWYEPGFAVLSPIYYIPNVGSFGQQQYAVQIELPKIGLPE